MLTGTVRRLFWVSLGATAGVLIFRQVTKAAKELTPAGIADRVNVNGGSLVDSVKAFVEDVRDAMHDREEELYVALGLDEPVEPTGDASAKDGAPQRSRLPEADAARAIKGRSDTD
jgi:hypothetical protein